MTTCIIELNDNEVRVGYGNDIRARSPGYALIDNNNIEIGEAAAKQARLNPRAVHNRYWKNLNQDPLQYPSARARHNADLHTYLQFMSKLANRKKSFSRCQRFIPTNNWLCY